MIVDLAAALAPGSFAAWFTFAAVVGAAWSFRRGGGGTAIQSLQIANQVLEKRVHELGGEIRDLRIVNATLTARTDYQAVINEHEARAADRHAATLKVLELIAGRLGPDPSEHA